MTSSQQYCCHSVSNYHATTDTNECAKNLDECAQICVDTDGSYYCLCDSGYILTDDGQGCEGEEGTHSFHNNIIALLRGKLQESYKYYIQQ